MVSRNDNRPDPSSSDNSGGDSFSWEQVVAEREAKKLAIRAQRQQAADVQVKKEETERLAHLLRYGIPGQPLAESYWGPVLASDRWIAETLLALAAAFRVFPGLAFLNRYPLPHRGLGHAAGCKLWSLAVAETPANQLADNVRAARKALEVFEGKQGILAGPDTQAGLLEVFIHFEAITSGGRWMGELHEIELDMLRDGDRVDVVTTARSDVEKSSSISRTGLADTSTNSGLTKPTTSTPSVAADRPWTAHRTGGMPLRGWKAILPAAGVSPTESQARHFNRLNKDTSGPIVNVMGRPQVDRGELLAWIEDSRGQAAALAEERELREIARQEPGDRGGARAADLGMNVVASRRGGRHRIGNRKGRS